MNHLSACKRQAVDTKRSERDMNCATREEAAVVTKGRNIFEMCTPIV
jgi:hypothetical protein